MGMERVYDFDQIQDPTLGHISSCNESNQQWENEAAGHTADREISSQMRGDVG